MPTLVVVSTPPVILTGGRLPNYFLFGRALSEAAHGAGWRVIACNGQSLPAVPVNEPALYVTTDFARVTARTLGIALLEPPLDLLARVPEQFSRRQVELVTFKDLERLKSPTFVKPADPLDKWFDAGIHADVRDIRTKGRVSWDAPVLLSEPVEWSVEFRYFVLDGKPVAGSRYLAYGRPAWKLFDSNRPEPMPTVCSSFVERLCADMGARLPPAFVVDAGLIDERGWAVVEFNPAWCAGLLGADPGPVLAVLRRATRGRTELSVADRQWLIERAQ